MSFYIGLDLGQSNDYTALAVVEKVKASEASGGGDPDLHLRHLGTRTAPTGPRSRSPALLGVLWGVCPTVSVGTLGGQRAICAIPFDAAASAAQTDSPPFMR